LGKVVLEKLLRSCTGIKRIYVMVRPKKNVDPMSRVEKEILNAECFKRLWEIHGSKKKF